MSRFAPLMKAAYPLIHAADDEAIVLPGGTSPAPDSLGTGAGDFTVNPVTWYAKCYQATGSGGGGLKDYMDALSHHPYHSPAWANNYSDGATTDWSSWRQMTGHLSPTPSIRSVMQANGDGTSGTANRKKIWIGEVGIPTKGSVGAVMAEGTAAFNMAVFMAEWKHYAEARAGDSNSGTLVGTYWDLAGPMCIYTYKDSEADGAAVPDWSRHEGLVKLDGSAKTGKATFGNVANAWNALG
jgi:hypothetical protein